MSNCADSVPGRNNSREGGRCFLNMGWWLERQWDNERQLALPEMEERETWCQGTVAQMNRRHKGGWVVFRRKKILSSHLTTPLYQTDSRRNIRDYNCEYRVNMASSCAWLQKGNLPCFEDHLASGWSFVYFSRNYPEAQTGWDPTHACSVGHRLRNWEGTCMWVGFHLCWKVSIWSFLGRARRHTQGWLHGKTTEGRPLVG